MDTKVISFDLDKTLIDTPSPVEIIYSFLIYNGVKPDKQRIREILSKINYSDRKNNPEEYYIAINQKVLGNFGLYGKKYARKLLEYWFSPSNYRLYPEVKEVLDILKNRYILVITSNNLSWEIKDVLNHISLSRYFKYIFSPDVTGSFKPSQKMYMYVAEKTGVRLSEVLHIGDNIEEDYLGALKSGVKALLIKRYITKNEEKILKEKKIMFITNLKQLLEMINDE